MHIKKGDAVQVIAGKDKGKQAKVIAVLPKENKVVVEGMGMVSKHQKPSNIFPDGGIIKKESPIHASNVQLVDPKTKKPTRTKMELNKNGEKIRVAVKTGNKIDK